MPTAALARLLTVTTLGWGLGACSTETPPLADQTAGAAPTPTAGDQALGEPGGRVAEVRAEATAVAHHLAEGTVDVATIRASFTGRLDAVDFEGRPSFYLVFTSTDPGIATPLLFASRQGPALLQAAGTSTVVGASEDQPEVAVAESGLSLLFELGETMLALGGVTQVDRVVAPLPGILLVVDRDGVYWDAKTRMSLSPATIEARKKALAEVAASERDAAAAIAREQWAKRRNGTGAPDVGLDSVKTPRGNLDLARAVDATVAAIDPMKLRVAARTAVQEELEASSGDRQGLWNSSNENCFSWWFFGWHSSCDHVEVGELGEPAKNQAHMPWQGRGNTMPMCTPLRGENPDTDTNASLGCGPAAFTALVWADWKAGGAYTSLARLDRTTISPYLAIDANYKAFSNAMGPVVADSMGTCSFGDDGALTAPSGFVRGGSAWLAANGSAKKVKMLGGVLGIGTGLEEVATALHERVGLRGRPTAAGFDLGFVSSHWSPVYRYRIVRPAGAGRLQVYIQSLDWKKRWYSLGGIKLLSALAWLE